MKDAALALDEHNVGIRRRVDTSCSAAPVTKSEITRSTAMPLPAIRMPSRPSQRMMRAPSSFAARSTSSRGHLADRAVAADRQNDLRGHVVCCASKEWNIIRRNTHVPQTRAERCDARRLRWSFKHSCKPLTISSPASTAANKVGRNADGSFPPVVATPTSNAVGPSFIASSNEHDRRSRTQPRQHFVDALARILRIDHGNHGVRDTAARHVRFPVIPTSDPSVRIPYRRGVIVSMKPPMLKGESKGRA